MQYCVPCDRNLISLQTLLSIYRNTNTNIKTQKCIIHPRAKSSLSPIHLPRSPPRLYFLHSPPTGMIPSTVSPILTRTLANPQIPIQPYNKYLPFLHIRYDTAPEPTALNQNLKTQKVHITSTLAGVTLLHPSAGCKCELLVQYSYNYNPDSV